MTAPFDEAAARKLLAEWPEVPGLDDLVAAFVEARAAVDARGGGREPVVAALREMLRLSEMGFEDSMREPEENGNYVAYNKAKKALADYDTAPQPAAEAWRFDLKAAPASEYGARPTYLLITNGKHVGVGFRQPSDDPDDYEWQDEETSYVPDVIAWQPLPPPPGSPTSVGAIPPEGLAAAQAALERLEARKAVPADEWAAQVAGAFVELGSDAESLGTRRVDPAAAVDAVGIVERMREEWRSEAKSMGLVDGTKPHIKRCAADEILAALRGEAR